MQLRDTDPITRLFWGLADAWLSPDYHPLETGSRRCSPPPSSNGGSLVIVSTCWRPAWWTGGVAAALAGRREPPLVICPIDPQLGALGAALVPYRHRPSWEDDPETWRGDLPWSLREQQNHDTSVRVQVARTWTGGNRVDAQLRPFTRPPSVNVDLGLLDLARRLSGLPQPFEVAAALAVANREALARLYLAGGARCVATCDEDPLADRWVAGV